MIEKRKQRILFSSLRNSLSKSEKDFFDRRILTAFLNSDFYCNFSVFLVYVSIGNEVDTINLIEILLENNKTVAVPLCHGNEMVFCKINSLNDLSVGTFGILEPNIKSEISQNEINDSICIVPGLSFDLFGNRLGYGKGFYDRFLSENNIVTVGFTYERCISNNLPADIFDKKIDYILTENKLRNSKM